MTDNPELLVNALSGDPSADASVYDVPSTMKQMLGADKSTTAGLYGSASPGSWHNGDTVTFAGVTEFANFQITDDPGKNLALVAAILIVLGLILSLARTPPSVLGALQARTAPGVRWSRQAGSPAPTRSSSPRSSMR